jgi:hypothetical protein
MKKNNLIKTLAFAAFFASAVSITGCDSGNKTHHDTHGAALNDESKDSEEALPDYSGVNEEFKTQIIDLTNHYFHIKDALVKTNAEEAKIAAENWLAAAEGINTADLGSIEADYFNNHFMELKKSVLEITSSEDVEKQREEFFNLSNGTYNLIKAFKAKATDIYLQYCPMAFNDKGAGWISNQKEIRNPYFGDKMLKCGKVKETL